MKIVTVSAEQHFRDVLPSLEEAPEGWALLHAALSSRLSPDNVFSDPTRIGDKLYEARRSAEGLCRDVGRSPLLKDATAYLFQDGDVLILIRFPGDGESQEALALLHEELSAKAGCSVAIRWDRQAESYCRKLVEGHENGPPLTMAYECMADAPRRLSVPTRRMQRPGRLALIVDEEDIAPAWMQRVAELGCEVIHARSGEDAIIQYLDNAPDIVFMDVRLPGIDGQRTLRALRRADPMAFVVMFSVDPGKTHVMRASQEGAAGFIRKTAEGERLAEMLNRAPFIHRKAGDTSSSA